MNDRSNQRLVSYLHAVEVEMRERHTEKWRRGQTYFNVLYRIDPVTANSIKDTEADPYYDDTRIDRFLALLQEVWA